MLEKDLSTHTQIPFFEKTNDITDLKFNTFPARKYIVAREYF